MAITWTAEQDKTLLALVDEGLTRREIADTLTAEYGEEVTYDSVRHRVEALKMMRPTTRNIVDAPKKDYDDKPAFVTCYGYCKYCSQSVEINALEDATADELSDIATAKCNCPEAQAARDVDIICEKTYENIHALCCDDEEEESGCRQMGFEPLPEAVVNFLESIAYSIVHRLCNSATVHVPGATVKMMRNKDNGVTVARSETNQVKIG